MDDLAGETFDLTLKIASGKRSVGERAGHSQVSLWRDWRLRGPEKVRSVSTGVPDGKPITVSAMSYTEHSIAFKALPGRWGPAADQIGLIVPTSLCSGQIARMMAERLNEGRLVDGGAVSRFVALPHTEGCGASAGENEEHFLRTLAGHLQHPFVREAMLLEHGCERTHNDLVSHYLQQQGIEPDRFGRASIQLDGGIEQVMDKVNAWFERRLTDESTKERLNAGMRAISLGILSVGCVTQPMASAMAGLAAGVVGAGGTVVLPTNASLLKSAHFRRSLGWRKGAPEASLEYGQVCRRPGLHIMSVPSAHMVEAVTGLGGSGVQVMVAQVGATPLQGHPMIPLIQVASEKSACFSEDLDHIFGELDDSRSIEQVLASLVGETASGRFRPGLWGAGNTDFQLTRGLLGVSL